MALRDLLLLVLVGCGGTIANGPNPNVDPPPAHPPADDLDAKLTEVARIHGAPGPWAVAGFRMGEYALHTFGLNKGSFDLEVVHYTPHEVQYSCIADGAAAATGASLGKLNLSLVDAPAADTHTMYRQKSTGKTVTLRVAKSFAERFANVPRADAGAAGRDVLRLRDDQIFEVVP